MRDTILCKLFGHSWKYRDFSKYIKSNGEKYIYTELRKCKRCNKQEYKYEDWVSEDLLKPDDRQNNY